MRYSLDQAIWEVLRNTENHPYDDSSVQSNQLNRWIGQAYMAATGRLQGSGNVIEYTEKDIRRAVAYLRLRALIGAGIGADAQEMRERVRDVASWHTDGWVVVTNEEPKVTWTDDVEDALATILTGMAVTIVPCALQVPMIPLG